MRFVITVLVLAIAAVSVAAQGDVSSAPIVWERYKFSNTAISIMLPKMPVALHRGDACRDFTKNSYFAYAENAVYELTVVEKSYAKIPDSCITKNPFGKNTLGARLNEMRNSKEKKVETSEARRGYRVNKFAADGVTRWIVDNMDENRWIEVAIAKRSDSVVDEDKFFDSLDIASDLQTAQGKQASLGSDRTLGDSDLKTPPVTTQPNTPVKESLRMIVAPRASYTDDARKKNIKGAVRLKVVLLANGGVGSIEVVQGLEGLTEQAIAAAKKIVFLPSRVNGVPVSVTKTMEYSFSIY